MPKSIADKFPGTLPVVVDTAYVYELDVYTVQPIYEFYFKKGEITDSRVELFYNDIKYQSLLSDEVIASRNSERQELRKRLS